MKKKILMLFLVATATFKVYGVTLLDALYGLEYGFDNYLKHPDRFVGRNPEFFEKVEKIKSLIKTDMFSSDPNNLSDLDLASIEFLGQNDVNPDKMIANYITNPTNATLNISVLNRANELKKLMAGFNNRIRPSQPLVAQTEAPSSYAKNSIFESEDFSVLPSDDLSVLPDGSIFEPDFSVRPQGSIFEADDFSVLPDGSIFEPDDFSVLPLEDLSISPDLIFKPGFTARPQGSVFEADDFSVLPGEPITIKNVHFDDSVNTVREYEPYEEEQFVMHGLNKMDKYMPWLPTQELKRWVKGKGYKELKDPKLVDRFKEVQEALDQSYENSKATTTEPMSEEEKQKLDAELWNEAFKHKTSEKEQEAYRQKVVKEATELLSQTELSPKKQAKSKSKQNVHFDDSANTVRKYEPYEEEQFVMHGIQNRRLYSNNGKNKDGVTQKGAWSDEYESPEDPKIIDRFKEVQEALDQSDKKSQATTEIEPMSEEEEKKLDEHINKAYENSPLDKNYSIRKAKERGNKWLSETEWPPGKNAEYYQEQPSSWW